MKSILIALALSFAALSVAPVAAYAQDGGSVVSAPAGAVAPDFDNPLDAAKQAVEQVKAKNWMALSALLLMAAAFYARKYAPSASFFHTFKGGIVLTVGAGVLSAVGGSLYTGHFDLNSLLSGLSATASAAFAIWSPKPAAPATPAV